MPISFDLESLRQKYNCLNYFETGLYDTRSQNSSIHKALSCGFKNIFSIEIKDTWVKIGKDIFNKEINEKRVHLYLDDSTNLNKYIMNETFNDRTIFFLDAHVDANNIRNFKKRCPLFEELKAISNMKRKDHIILIDDLRIINLKFPWGEKSYGKINFIDQIKEQILSINKEYKFDTLNGHIENDVLIAYI